MLKNSLLLILQVFRTDGGTEYFSKKMHDFLVTHGIVHQFSCPSTSAQNGVAERKHKHIMETIITLIHHLSLPLHYWFEAIATVTFLINRTPSSVLHNKSPFEVFFHCVPNYSFFRIFGCQCFPWLRSYGSSKFHPRSLLCLFRLSPIC
ncbi:unnamed protein product [Camellia sinensis]